MLMAAGARCVKKTAPPDFVATTVIAGLIGPVIGSGIADYHAWSE